MKQQPTLSSLHTTHHTINHTSIIQTQHKTTVHTVFVLGYLGLFLRWAVPEISTKKKYHNSKIIFSLIGILLIFHFNQSVIIHPWYNIFGDHVALQF